MNDADERKMLDALDKIVASCTAIVSATSDITTILTRERFGVGLRVVTDKEETE